MLDIVRILTGALGLAGLVYLARQIPPLLTEYQRHQTRVGGAKRYSEWRGVPGAGPDTLDRLEGQLIAARLKRLAGVGLASIVGIALALFPPLR
jgi:hypothetical protein